MTFALAFVMAQAPLEQRVDKLEKAMSDAGRAMLFRNEGFVNPPKAVPATFPLPMAGTSVGAPVAFRAAPVRTVFHGTRSMVARVVKVPLAIVRHPVKTVGYALTPWRR